MKYKIKKIMVIGAGGTGSFLLSHLARLIKGYDLKVLVEIWDGDIIENERNLLRSPMFCVADISQYKSQVMATRLNLFYGLDCFSSHPHYVSFERGNYNMELDDSLLIITCVDKMKFRQDLGLFFEDKENDIHREGIPYIFWLDCGNDKNFGQAYMGFNNSNYPSAQWYNFYSLRDGKRINSCSVATFKHQGPMSNDLSAVCAMYLAEPLIVKGKYKYKSVYFGEYGVRTVKPDK
jgi:hypothetical protein